jgi:LPXTG-motif cell wall-anchored protein
MVAVGIGMIVAGSGLLLLRRRRNVTDLTE